MATEPRNAKGQLPSTAGALLTSGDNQAWQITKIDIHNGSGSDVSDVLFYIAATGGSASASTSIYKIGSLAAGGSRNIPLSSHTLRDGDILFGVAGTGSAVNYVISYQKITG